jgi:hypothetical protein
VVNVTYEEVVRLAEQLSPAEQQALVAHLQILARQRALSMDEWQTLFDATISRVPVLSDIALRREDWYAD